MRAIVTTILMLGIINLFAQDPAARRKIELAKIALITERVGLTPEQAEKFWPLYREYSQKKLSLRKEGDSLREASRQVNEAESKAVIEKTLAVKEEALQLEKNYNEKFRTVLSDLQILKLRQTEEEFKHIMLDRLNNRRDPEDKLNRQRQRRLNK